ncbi:hypothetical protein HOLleu_23941 [Holothuria leucospilota]|uniref:Uncharacterized protein n=1 Tax=Holothuria leucospilota TaxID=206669 RepID=A0A9Q1H5Z8_HOLLE|nr:hypothetical protein HOLleu_23941 [Holothuria leucospilota]
MLSTTITACRAKQQIFSLLNMENMYWVVVAYRKPKSFSRSHKLHPAYNNGLTVRLGKKH